MGLIFDTTPADRFEPKTVIKAGRAFECAVSRRKTLKRLTLASRRYLISLGFKVGENK